MLCLPKSRKERKREKEKKDIVSRQTAESLPKAPPRPASHGGACSAAGYACTVWQVVLHGRRAPLHTLYTMEVEVVAELPTYTGFKQLAMHPNDRLWVSEMTVRKLRVHPACTAVPERVRPVMVPGAGAGAGAGDGVGAGAGAGARSRVCACIYMHI